MLNVTIINGSPNKEKSNTSFILAPFIKGMENSGATVEMIYTSNLNLKPCIGCFKCWSTHIEKCFHKDDMENILPKLKDSEILIFATPIYIQLPGMFQIFLNRIVPLIEPILEFRDGRTRAKFHDDVKISKILAVIVGGWWEKENSDVVKSIIEEISETSSTEFLGAIRRPHSQMLRQKTERNAEILSILTSIGQKLINNGKIDEDDLEFVRQPLIQESDFRKMANEDYMNSKNASL